jgi:hypothetical protein
VGYLIRRSYRKREIAYDKVFDFEKGTREIVEKKIITTTLG